MRYARWFVLFATVAVAAACKPFVAPHTDGSADGTRTSPDRMAGGSESAAEPPAPDSSIDATAPKPNGTSCTGDGECATGHCVDATCCATPSCPACQACDLNHAGTCSAKPRGAADPACPTSAMTCSAGGCDGYGACLPSAKGTECGSSVCTNG